MPVGKELFKLYGLIGMHGVESTVKNLNKVDRQARKVQRQMEIMGRKVSKAGKTLTKVFTLPLAAASIGIIKFIEKGGDLNETISKTNELFGESSLEIQQWASNAALAIGQTKQQAMDAASTFAIFGKSAGLAGKDLVKFSTGFAELASDMSSFFNTSPEDAIQAIGAALRGETEPIRRYGVMLDDATMRQKALELGLVTTTKKALLPQTKVLAAQALIFEKTKAAQGDFARTSDQLANKSRILKARWENVSATLGSLFLPLALKAVNIFGGIVDKIEKFVLWFSNLNNATKKTLAGFVLLLAGIGPVTIAIGKLIAFSKLLIPLFVALKTGALTWSGAMGALSKSMLGTVTVIASLVAVGWYYYSQWDSISKQLIALWAQVKFEALKIVQSWSDIFTEGIDKILVVVGKLASFIPGLENKIKDARIGILKFRASLSKLVIAQSQNVSETNAQSKATGGFLDNVKKSIEAAKTKLGLSKKNTEETKIQTQIEKEALEAAKKKTEEETKAAKKLAEEKQKFEENLISEINSLRLNEQEQLNVLYSEKLEEAKRLGADIYAVEQWYHYKKMELKKKEIQADRRQFNQNLSLSQNIGNKINNIVSKFSDNKLKRIDLEEKRRIAEIQSTRMSEEQKEIAIQKTQEKADKQRQIIEKNRMRREKLAALFSIAVNTARAIVEALPNIPLSIGMGILGGIQGAAVASEPEPFFEGALVEGSENGITGRIGERNQDELIFPLESGIDLMVDRFLEKLSSIEFPAFETSPSIADIPFGNTTVNHLHVGTLIGDERSYKKLERRLDNIRIAESQRKGE